MVLLSFPNSVACPGPISLIVSVWLASCLTEYKVLKYILWICWSFLPGGSLVKALPIACCQHLATALQVAAKWSACHVSSFGGPLGIYKVFYTGSWTASWKDEHGRLKALLPFARQWLSSVNLKFKKCCYWQNLKARKNWNRFTKIISLRKLYNGEEWRVQHRLLTSVYLIHLNPSFYPAILLSKYLALVWGTTPALPMTGKHRFSQKAAAQTSWFSPPVTRVAAILPTISLPQASIAVQTDPVMAAPGTSDL